MRTSLVTLFVLALLGVARAQEQPAPKQPAPKEPADRHGQPVSPPPKPEGLKGRGAPLPKREPGAALDPARPDPVAPRWEVGQWWEVAVDLALERGAEGLSLRAPSAALPGLARRGPDPGYQEVARWRLRVVKTQRFAVPGANDGSWQLGWFVEARRFDREARQPTSLTLVFVGPSKALSDIGVRRPGQRVRWLNYDADAILQPPLEPALQLLPLAWPDLRGAERLSGRGHRGEKVQQRRRSDRSGVYFDLRGGPSEPSLRIRWRAGEPWPARIAGETFTLRLLRSAPAPAERPR